MPLVEGGSIVDYGHLGVVASQMQRGAHCSDDCSDSQHFEDDNRWADWVPLVSSAMNDFDTITSCTAATIQKHVEVVGPRKSLFYWLEIGVHIAAPRMTTLSYGRWT